MAVLIKDKKKPSKCEWVDNNHDLHRCVMLDGEDNCVLQDCEEEWTWSEQYANCPLVEVPDAQTEKKSLNGDVIDRQAAITIPIPPKWNRKYLTTNLDDAYELGWDDCKKCIEALPSAQPGKRTDKRTETHACDSISRQAAIEAAVDAADDWDGGWNPSREAMIEEAIRKLPPAQPDTIPIEWIQKYADDWHDVGYAYENPILGMLEDWRSEQDG